MQCAGACFIANMRTCKSCQRNSTRPRGTHNQRHGQGLGLYCIWGPDGYIGALAECGHAMLFMRILCSISCTREKGILNLHLSNRTHVIHKHMQPCTCIVQSGKLAGTPRVQTEVQVRLRTFQCIDHNAIFQLLQVYGKLCLD